MSLRTQKLGGEEMPEDEEDEKRRLPFFHLVGLAAGGVIGSGWLMGASKTYRTVGPHGNTYLPWIIGGLVMLVIAGVMVELGVAVPRTGGLIFLPLQTSGALVATVVAAGLWIFYAINSAAEAIAMTKGLASWLTPETDALNHQWIYVLAFMAVISAVNLAAPWLFYHINSWLTVVKVVIPLLTVVLLIAYYPARVVSETDDPSGPFAGALAAVVSGGVVYAYVGFQGPLDLADQIKRGGIGAAARLRRAVFGTIIGSMALYMTLQYVYDEHRKVGNDPHSAMPFLSFAHAGNSWLELLLKIAAVISPLGAGLVFTYALTREVSALARNHLTHRGLWTARTVSWWRQHEIYWLAVVVDALVGVIMLLVFDWNGQTLVEITGILAPIVYAFQGVVLVSLNDRRLTGHSRLRRTVHRGLAQGSFALIALILYAAGWSTLWRSMTTLAVGCTVLFVLPLLPRWLPSFGRFYDANEYVTSFRQWRTRPRAAAATLLIGYLVALTLLTRLGHPDEYHYPKLCAFLAAAMALVVFEGLVRMSRRHMVDEPPNLPTLAPSWAASGEND